MSDARIMLALVFAFDIYIIQICIMSVNTVHDIYPLMWTGCIRSSSEPLYDRCNNKRLVNLLYMLFNGEVVKLAQPSEMFKRKTWGLLDIVVRAKYKIMYIKNKCLNIVL